MEWIELGELAEVQTGKLDANAAVKNGKYPFFTCANEVSFIDEYEYDKECILVAGNGNLNVKYYNGKFNAYQRTYIIESKNKNKLNTMFLFYFMNTYMDRLRDLSIGGVIKYIKLGHLTEAKIPVPPIETQKQIVEVLDEAQNLIDNRKKQIELLDELVESIFYEMFGEPVKNDKGWDVKKLDDVMIIDTNMITDFTDYQEYPHIGIGNIQENTGKLINYKTVKEDKITSGKYLFDEKHLIYSKIRPYLNKVAYPKIAGLCSADSYPILPKEGKINIYYLWYILRTDAFLNIVSKSSSRTNIPKINKKQLLDVQFIIPPISLQNQFAEKVEQIESQKQLMEKSLKLMEDNYNNLMQRAFKGELF